MAIKTLIALLILVMAMMAVDAIVDRIILVEERVEHLEGWHPTMEDLRKEIGRL